ncbi:hypothetical protein BDZ89DRAFT_1140044 [Hymenopellis radicata]|nr:hypothetical protein BDZ89DRAFT_1140044 [Hymenopellis radicata]
MSFGRLPIYAVYCLFWIISCVELGLTAYRVHLTEHQGSIEPIMVELIVSSSLAIFWIPIASLMLMGDPEATHTRSKRIVPIEVAGACVLWVMWLVGAVYTTNKILPGKNYCVAGGKECHILTAILAFSWMGWSLLSIVIVMGLMHLAATRTPKEKPIIHEKAAEAAGQV